MKYRKKPVVIEAFEWLGNYEGSAFALGIWVAQSSGKSFDELVNNNPFFITKEGELEINTLEGKMTAQLKDFIICGVNGEFYPCKPDIFEKTYEVVED